MSNEIPASRLSEVLGEFQDIGVVINRVAALINEGDPIVVNNEEGQLSVDGMLLSSAVDLLRVYSQFVEGRLLRQPDGTIVQVFDQ